MNPLENYPVLSLLIVLPMLVGMVLQIRSGRTDLGRGIALATGICSFFTAAVLLVAFPNGLGFLHFQEQYPWLRELNIHVHLGLDGGGALLVMLATVVSFLVLITSWNTSWAGDRFHGLVLILQSCLIGNFCSQDFLPWFLFWEISLLPAYFMIRAAGGQGAEQASIRFFLYTFIGSLGLLLGFVAIHRAVGTWDFSELAALASAGTLGNSLKQLGSGWHQVVFWGVLIGLVVKVPMMPLHGWQAPTYGSAPAPTSMLLTGVMSKMGLYAMIRILLPLFGDLILRYQSWLIGLALLTTLGGCVVALAQTNIRRMLAYSSLNHTGYCLLGLFAVAGLTDASIQSTLLGGVMLQMINHGITAACLFAFVHFLETRRGVIASLDGFGGWRTPAPVLCGFAATALFASIGLPGLNGFPGEFLIFRGLFASHPLVTCMASLGLLLTAVFLLRILQHVFHGPYTGKPGEEPNDLDRVERLVALPGAVLLVLLGIAPQLILSRLQDALHYWVKMIS